MPTNLHLSQMVIIGSAIVAADFEVTKEVVKTMGLTAEQMFSLPPEPYCILSLITGKSMLVTREIDVQTIDDYFGYTKSKKLRESNDEKKESGSEAVRATEGAVCQGTQQPSGYHNAEHTGQRLQGTDLNSKGNLRALRGVPSGLPESNERGILHSDQEENGDQQFYDDLDSFEDTHLQ